MQAIPEDGSLSFSGTTDAVPCGNNSGGSATAVPIMKSVQILKGGWKKNLKVKIN